MGFGLIFGVELCKPMTGVAQGTQTDLVHGNFHMPPITV